ncbi:MAG: hypothetical protein AB7S75_04045 [Desulfococcaceae bacterium]
MNQNIIREIPRMKKFGELQNGAVFMFPGDRRGSVKDTGFVKIGSSRYTKIAEFRKNSGEHPVLRIVPELEVFHMKGLSPSRN